MKKSLVLAMAMALGVTASAYAANPFSDVPAGHWAYDSISKLAAAGVIEGYGDDTFRGDRLMTRYEMAQIVARAMAKGANVDKLAAEFADELDKLNVRVAALEKKSDNVKITGEIRYHYKHQKPNNNGEKYSEHGLRTRLYFTGKVNDNWNYVARIQNQQWFHKSDDPFTDNRGDDGVEFNIAKLEGRLGGINVIAGRDDDVFANGYIFDGEHDAIKMSYGSKWYISGAYGKLTDANEDAPTNSLSIHFANAEIGSNIEGSFVNGKVGYLKTSLGNDGYTLFDRNDRLGILYVGADFNLVKDLTFNAMYLHSDRDKYNNVESKKDGYVFGLGYKGAEASEPGSWGLTARYYHQGRGTYLLHTIDGETNFDSGFKGWSFGGEVTLAKNMVASVTYYDTKALKADDKAKVIWSEFNVMF